MTSVPGSSVNSVNGPTNPGRSGVAETGTATASTINVATMAIAYDDCFRCITAILMSILLDASVVHSECHTCKCSRRRRSEAIPVLMCGHFRHRRAGTARYPLSVVAGDVDARRAAGG